MKIIKTMAKSAKTKAKSAKDKAKPVIITVSDDALSKIDQLADECKEMGMNIERVLPITGVITGSISESKIDHLKNVSGVLSVEPEMMIELPPPDSNLQ